MKNLAMLDSPRRFKGLDYRHAFQPIIRPSSGEIFGYEVLLRGPQEQPPWFIFERISPSDKAMFEHTINETALTYSNLLGNEKLLFINVLPETLLIDQGQYLIDLWKSQPHQVDPTQIVIELSESGLQRDIRVLSRALDMLRSAGFVIALDDFGAGSAGLNSLVDVNPDIIKLDMHLVRSIHESGVRQVLIKSVLSFADALGILVLAEGVETVAEYNHLRNLGIDLFQGYLFARPKIDYLARTFHLPIF
ncbi:MAG: EAL domain-containing protein [Oceanospirillaceae bacterium]|nr:EAL domain-containing protein [Oceanospirillaceae bacterium]